MEPSPTRKCFNVTTWPFVIIMNSNEQEVWPFPDFGVPEIARGFLKIWLHCLDLADLVHVNNGASGIRVMMISWFFIVIVSLSPLALMIICGTTRSVVTNLMTSPTKLCIVCFSLLLYLVSPRWPSLYTSWTFAIDTAWFRSTTLSKMSLHPQVYLHDLH